MRWTNFLAIALIATLVVATANTISSAQSNLNGLSTSTPSNLEAIADRNQWPQILSQRPHHPPTPLSSTSPSPSPSPSLSPSPSPSPSPSLSPSPSPSASPQPTPKECSGKEIVTAPSCLGDGLEPEETKLYEAINTYRNKNKLPAIPLSKSLSLVANRHVLDLAKNTKNLNHGWSDCPYDSKKRDSLNCMWKAPQRLKTAYPGNGYENTFGGSGGYAATAEDALKSWTSDPPHNAVILNQGGWKKLSWQALGVGIYKGYAVMWVGEETDPAN